MVREWIREQDNERTCILISTVHSTKLRVGSKLMRKLVRNSTEVNPPLIWHPAITSQRKQRRVAQDRESVALNAESSWMNSSCVILDGRDSAS